MATAKNKKAAANKKSTAKAGAKKPAPKKAAATKSVKVSAKKPAKAPLKPAAPKGKAMPAKKSAAKSSGAKPANKSGNKSVVNKAPVKAAKKTAGPVASKPVKTAVKTTPVKNVPKQNSKKTEAVSKEVKKEKKEEKSATAANVNSRSVVSSKKEQAKPLTPAAKPAKPAKPTKAATSKKKGEDEEEEGPDPLHLKADKVIKELEEIMDLSKMRPRIQAGSSPKPTLVKHAHPPIKLVEPVNTTKEKFQLEFEFRSSPKILFTSLSDSSGLAGWFADEVKTKDDLYTFIWEGGESYAKLVAIRDLQLVRFQWVDDTDGTYFQFEIKEDDITSDIALVITDFANPGEKDSSIKLWESQVQNLRLLLGSL